MSATRRERAAMAPSVRMSRKFAPCMTSIVTLTTPQNSANGLSSAQKVPS